MENNDEGIVVLSLFDGMSAGQVALQRAGVKVKQYYASEIDKHSIQVTMANFPNTIQLGDVTQIDPSILPKVQLLIGGSPCQSFSFAGKQKGMATKCEQEILSLETYLELKEQGFEFEGQSYLFWEYMRIKHATNPDYFFLENVTMAEKWRKVLTRAIGINSICINSSLVSAQNRERLYWTNIGSEPDGLFGEMECKIPQPKDRRILLKDVLEKSVDEKYYLKEKLQQNYLNKKIENRKSDEIDYKDENHTPEIILENPDKSFCIDANYHKGNSINDFVKKNRRQLIRVDKIDIIALQNCLKEHKNQSVREISNKLDVPKEIVESWFKTDSSFSIPSEEIWESLKNLIGITTNEFDKLITDTEQDPQAVAMRGRQDETGKWIQQIEPRDDGKTNSLTTVEKDNLVKVSGGDYRSDEGYRWREGGKAATLTRGSDKSGTQYTALVKIDEKIEDDDVVSGTLRTHKDGNGFREVKSGKGATVPARAREDGSGQNVVRIMSRIRRLTPVECERLQTFEDGYSDKSISETQRYKMLGNSWTVEVVAYIFGFLPYPFTVK